MEGKKPSSLFPNKSNITQKMMNEYNKVDIPGNLNNISFYNSTTNDALFCPPAADVVEMSRTPIFRPKMDPEIIE